LKQEVEEKSFVYQDEGVELMRQGKDRVEGAQTVPMSLSARGSPLGTFERLGKGHVVRLGLGEWKHRKTITRNMWVRSRTISEEPPSAI